ncbi:metallophosphatase family protein [Sporosarcina sp. P12(2017)]|uniref:metallophosphoesterase family protein n=1 Tax=unclassified Sporosarcina TaxID=2647733 RepID=UPI000C171C82|nr:MULTISPECIES: metallophosphoesterase family protein [unclassified Sporosarcina]PIC58957.1 metallophosphatase family protein [Sporosarcina sp. P10]PIC62277.1 metallophosphatase family protein [Sporosarcina sp. P12(2017)]
MQYALLGDIHSSKEDLQAVLAQIADKAPEATLIGTGDLYECTVSKKDLHGQIYPTVEEVIKHPDGIDELFTFPSIYGNQEERILLLTKQMEPIRNFLNDLPETLKIDQAVVIHGHQWPHNEAEAWLAEQLPEAPLVFHGHTHRSSFMSDGKPVAINWNDKISVRGSRTVVNVGAVVGSREWVLYDSEKQNVSFMKVSQG